MIDADPQGTISNWGRRRTNPKPRIEPADSGTAIERAILHLRSDGFTVAIIDTAATNNSLSTSGIGAADLCLIPARPSPADIEAALPTLSAVRRLDKRFAFVLNQTPGRSNRVSEAAIALSGAGVSRFLASPSATTIKTLSEWAWASPSTIPTGKPQKRYTISGGGPGNH